MLNKIKNFFGVWWGVLKQTWKDIFSDELNIMKLVVGISGVTLSINLGIIDYNSIPVNGWQLLTWGISVLVVTVILFISKTRPQKIRLKGWQWIIVVIPIAFVLRFYALEANLLHVDELGVSGFALNHVFSQPGRTINPFITGTSSMPSFFFYFPRLSYYLFGYSITALRLPSVLAGTLAVFMVYVMVKELKSRRAGLFAAVLMAGYHYHIHWSRMALNNVWDTVWVPMMLAGYAYGWRKKWSGGAVISGFALGMSQYFYPGARLGIFMLVFLIIWLYRKDTDRKSLLVFSGKLSLVALTIAAPLLIYAILKSDIFFQRMTVVFAWKEEYILQAVGTIDYWKFFQYQLIKSLGAFTGLPDMTGFYRPDVPFLFGLSAVLFTIGFFWAIIKKQWFPVIWIVLTFIFAGMLIFGVPSSSHYVISIPAIVWLIALPLEWLSTRNKKGLLVLSIVLLIIMLLTDFFFYFFVYLYKNNSDLIFELPPWPFP